MGLDQYAYVGDGAQESQREIAYWRKHPFLQGWMENLWVERGRPAAHGPGQENEYDVAFNGIDLELTWEDLEALEYAVKNNLLPETSGFFFGDNSSEYYRERDLEFIRAARAELFMGLRVFYNSSW